MPHLFKTARAIYAYRPVVTNKKAEAMMNFKLSVRGSIRQAPNCMTWIIMLMNLKGYGITDASAVIKEWNDENPRSSALIGGKAQAVKLLLGKAPRGAIDFLSSHVSFHGWSRCAFSDDALASKKVYPGFTFKHQRPGWTDRCKVTECSMVLSLKQLFGDWASKPEPLRRKTTKKEMEESAEISALVWSIYNDVINNSNLKAQTVKEAFLDLFATGVDTELMMEIASIMQEKQEVINYERLSPLKVLMLQSSSSAGQAASAVSLTRDLERHAFEQVQSQINHDVTATLIYAKKMLSFEKAMYWKKLEWKNNQNKQIHDTLFHTMNTCATLVPFENDHDMQKKFLEYKLTILNKPLLKVEDKQLASRPDHLPNLHSCLEWGRGQSSQSVGGCVVFGSRSCSIIVLRPAHLHK